MILTAYIRLLYRINTNKQKPAKKVLPIMAELFLSKFTLFSDAGVPA